MIDRAIDLLDACRITPTNHDFSDMLSSKVIRKIKTFDPAAIVALAEAKEIFSTHFQHLPVSVFFTIIIVNFTKIF